MINIFGTSIEAPKIDDNLFIDNLLFEVAKKDSERKVLRQFLTSRLSEITIASQDTSGNQDISSLKPAAYAFYLSQLKSSGAYEKMVLKMINSKTSSLLLQGKHPVLPSSFPGDHKKAEAMVNGSISSSIGDKEYRSYLIYRNIQSRLQLISKDLFYAVNNGLNEEQALKYMAIMYELEKIKTAEFTNSPQIKSNILTAVKTDNPLQLVHMKCLRFTFPDGNRLQLLENTEDTTVSTKEPGRSHRPKDESQLFVRLKNLINIFQLHNIPVQLTVLLSDQETEDYFPGGDVANLVPQEDLANTVNSLQKYMAAVSQKLPGATVCFLREFLNHNGTLAQFDSIRQKTISELSRGNSDIPEKFVESRVNYRYTSNERIFTTNPGRQFARKQSYGIFGSLQAISVLGQNIILIEDDRGDENNYIGGHGRSALPVIFCQLRDRFD